MASLLDMRYTVSLRLFSLGSGRGKEMPESRTTILLSVIGLALSALGVWLAYSENQRKANEARPVLDITEPQVIRQSIGGRYEIKFTIHNRGKVEASNTEVHADTVSVTLANSLPSCLHGHSLKTPPVASFPVFFS